MKTHPLFPWIFRPVGLLMAPLFWWLLTSDVTLSFLQRSPASVERIKSVSAFYSENSSGDLWMLGLVLSLLFIAFSRLKEEDEYTAHLRLRALIRSVYINFVIAVLLIFFAQGLQFLFFAAMHSLALLIVFSVLFYGPLLLRRSAFSRSGHA